MKGPGPWILCALAVLLTGCFHKQQQPPPQQVAPELAQTPPPAPAVATVPLPTPPAPEPAAETKMPGAKAEKPPKPHPRKRADKPGPEVVATPETPAVEAIGQLSAGGSGEGQKRVKESLAATENGLKQINRPLSDQEKKTVDQIREFLKEAWSALNTGDTDGASTLAVKAKVLLGELVR